MAFERGEIRDSSGNIIREGTWGIKSTPLESIPKIITNFDVIYDGQVSTYSKTEIDSSISTAKAEANTYTDGAITTAKTEVNAYTDTGVSDAKSYTDTAIANLVGTAPAAMDTIYELATALQNNPSQITDIYTQLGTKAPLASPTFTGTVVLPSTTSIGTVSNTEIGYLDGVTSALQTQLNAKSPLASPTFTGTVTLPSTTSIGTVSSTELGYLDGVTSAIQTQLNAKSPLASPTFTGTPVAPTAAVGTNTTQIATTEFVNAEIANDAPSKSGTGAYGTWGISITGSSASCGGNSATASSVPWSGITSKPTTLSGYGITDGISTTGTQTLTNKTFTGYTETVYALSGSSPVVSSGNGTIQTWTLAGDGSPIISLSSGQSVTLMIDDGSAYTITWPTISWKTNTGTAPTLNTDGYTAIQIWNVNDILYGARVGDA